MRTIITLAIGYWIARQIYINFDKEQSRIKEEKARKRLTSFLKANGLSRSEADAETKRILRG